MCFRGVDFRSEQVTQDEAARALNLLRHNRQSFMDGPMIQDSECETGSGYLSELLVPLNMSQEGSAVCQQEKRNNLERLSKRKEDGRGMG